jgi:hypothetical protein
MFPAPTGPRIPAQGETLGNVEHENPWRVLKERRISPVGVTRHSDLCGVPSERGNGVAWHTQSVALGWYALPRWGKRMQAWPSFIDPSIEEFRPQRGHAYQPRVKPWEREQRDGRVLKERRIGVGR